jgi:protein-disulfide isomerase
MEKTSKNKRKTSGILNPLSAPSKPVETITLKRSHFQIAMVALAFSTGLLVGFVAWGRTPVAVETTGANQPAAQLPVAQAPVQTQVSQYTRYAIPTDGFPSLGPANAPITIVEFTDFQCPFCLQFYQNTYQPLLAAYPGKIRFVHRNFPLTSIHPNAFPAAEAAMCANEQNSFWAYHDALFADQPNLGDALYRQIASTLNLNLTTFQDCLTTHKYQKEIQADSDFAVSKGVNATPTFFINGLAVIGAQPLDAFKQVIDQELAGTIPK